MPAQSTELKVQDATIKLHRAGRGPTVLFLHGAGGVPQWLPFFDALAERYELLVPEHPGFGSSDDPPWIQPAEGISEVSQVDAAGTSNSRLTRQKPTSFQWLAVPLWLPPGKDSVPADSGGIPFTILRSRKRVTRRHRLGLQTIENRIRLSERIGQFMN